MRFQREARVLTPLNHSNIAAIYGVKEIDSRHFLVMELVVVRFELGFRSRARFHLMEGDMNQRLAIALSACMMALCFFSMNQASAQLNTADILGTVSDSAGAVVPNVKVTAQNIATNDTKTVVTSSTGVYVFNLMIPGQ